jgi:predicted  nucleic acid-binding Zn-ribbon protein
MPRWSSRHSHDEINRKLEHHHELLHQIKEGIITMSAELDRLTTEVAETKSAVASVLTLVAGLAQQIRDNATDPAALNALADDLDASQKDIADAITANTPAEEPPTT